MSTRPLNVKSNYYRREVLTESRTLHNTPDGNQRPGQRRSDAPWRVADVKTSLPNSSEPKHEDASNSQDRAPTRPRQFHAGNHSLEGIQRRLGSCERSQPVVECSPRQFGRSRSEVADTHEQNAQRGLAKKDLIFSTERPFLPCFPAAVNQAFSTASLSAFDRGNKLETEADLISNTRAAMFTSTIVSVLAPHWSGKSRRHKQGLSEAEPDIPSIGLKKNLSGSTQNIRQKSFFLNQAVQPHTEWNDGFNNKISGTTGTGRNFAEWQKDVPENISSSRPFLKATSLSPNCQTADMTEFGEEPRPAHSLQLNDYRRMSRPADQEKFQSLRSRPTTSTLLLSSRRLNSQKANAQPLQMNKQLSASVSSLNTPGKGILKHSSPYSPILPSKESNVLSASLEHLSCAGRSDASRTILYSRHGDYDISTKAPPPVTREHLFSNDISSKSLQVTNKDAAFSNSKPRFNQPETHKYFQRPQREFLTRQDSPVENSGTVGLTSTDKENLYSSTNFNIYSPQSSANWNSPKEAGNSRFLFTPELNTRSPVSPSYLRSENNTNRNNSTSSATSPNYNTSSASFNQPLSPLVSNINYTLNSDKTNNVYNTTSYTSLSSPKSYQSPAISTSVALSAPSVQSHVQSPSSTDKFSSSPVSSFRMRTFTDRLSVSPKKDSSVDETSPTHKWQNYLNSRRLLESTQNVADQPVPQSPSDFKLRRACSSSIYSYLRENSSPNTADMPSPFSSSSPLTPSLKQDRSSFLRDDKSTANLRFSFDFSPAGSQDGDFKLNSPTMSSPQSLPADTGGRSMTRLSKSPYSTLISSRQRLSSASSPSPSSQNGPHHKRSMSFDSSVTGIDSPKDDSYLSTNKYQLIYRTMEDPVGSSNNHVRTRTALGTPAFLSRSSQSLNVSSEDCLDTRLADHRTTNLLTNTSHSKKGDGYIKITPHKGLNGEHSSHRDKGHTSPTDVTNSKKVSSPPSTATITETVLEDVIHEPLQRSPSISSRKGLFSLLNRKDNLLTADKEDSGSKKGESTGFKTTKKMDQMLQRLKMTFGVKLGEEDFPSVKKKTKNQEASDIKSENTKKGDDRLSERLTLKSTKSANSQISTERESDRSSVPADSKLERATSNPQIINDHKGLYKNRSLFQVGQSSSQNAKKDGVGVESASLKSPKTLKSSNSQITAVKESGRSYCSLSEYQPGQQEDKPFDVNVTKQHNLLKSDTQKVFERPIEKPCRVSSLEREPGDPSSLVPGSKLGKQETLNVDTHQTLDGSILRSTSRPVWGKVEDTKKEEEKRFDRPTLHSQKSSSSRMRSVKETGSSFSPKAGFNLDYDQPKSTRKEDNLNVNSQKSPSHQVTSLRDSGHSSSPTSGRKYQRQNNAQNIDDVKLQSLNLPGSTDFRKEEHKNLKSQNLKSLMSPITCKDKSETSTISVSGFKSENQESSLKQLDQRKRGSSSPISPNWPAPDLRDRSATLPLGRKSSFSRSPTPHSIDVLLEDVQNDNVFYSPTLRKKSHDSLDPESKLPRLNSTGPDLMYGLQRSRSVSVCSVVSGRPSGPGRISTGSKHGSISDLSNLDGTRSRNSSINSPVESPDYPSTRKPKGSTGPSSPDCSILNPVNMKATLCSWEVERDPTPPPSPTFSRRMSQVSGSPDALCPRRFLSSKSCTSSFSAFDESGSDTTTDDEYYLNGDDDDDQETEL